MGLRFLKIAVVYLLIGALLGLGMGIAQNFALIPVHAHLLLLGWASLALAGVVYHLYPAASTTRLARIHFWMGRTHSHRSDRQQALQYFRQAQAGAHEVEAEASSMIGRVLATQGYCGQARPLLTQALAPLERAANGEPAYHLNWIEYILTLGYLGDVLAACGQYSEGLLMVQRALALALERGNLVAVAFGYLHLALAYFFGGETQRVLEESRAVVGRAEQAGDWVRAYIGYGLRAWAENQLGQHEAAQEVKLFAHWSN